MKIIFTLFLLLLLFIKHISDPNWIQIIFLNIFSVWNNYSVRVRYLKLIFDACHKMVKAKSRARIIAVVAMKVKE